MATVKWVLVIWLIPALALAARGEKRIAVFVGLADNATQGIAKVGAKIGDGDQPDDNLYWGCTDGLKSLFKASSKWKLEQRVTDTGDPRILERLVFRHANPDALLVAEAWRGAKLRDCYEAFQQAGVSGNHDLVAFIGHNVLMACRQGPRGLAHGRRCRIRPQSTYLASRCHRRLRRSRPTQPTPDRSHAHRSG